MPKKVKNKNKNKNTNINKNKIVINIGKKSKRKVEQPNQPRKQVNQQQPIYIPMPQQPQQDMTNIFKSLITNVKSNEDMIKKLYEQRPVNAPVVNPVQAQIQQVNSVPVNVDANVKHPNIFEDDDNSFNVFSNSFNENTTSEEEKHAENIASSSSSSSSSSSLANLPIYEDFGPIPIKSEYFTDDGKIKRGSLGQMRHDLKQYAGKYYQEKVDGRTLNSSQLFDFVLENVNNQLPKNKGGRRRN